jgi:hypothetical protein
MDCARVEGLAPLLVGGELDADLSDQVRRHAATCERCRLTVEEYKESRDWLREFRMPELGSGTYDDFRKAIWQKIEDRPPRPALVGLAGRTWEWLRLVAAQPAVAVAGVLIVGLAAFGMYRHHTSGSSAAAGLDAARGTSAMSPSDLADLELEEELELDEGGEQILAQAGFETLEAGGDLSEQVEGLKTTGDSKRVEIETKNPDVRIIWFGPRDERAALEN